MFSRYVAASRSLEKLNVRAYNEVRQNSLKWVLEGLLGNRTVTDASLTGLIMDFESCALMVDVLTRNKVLRRLNISIFTFDEWIDRLGGCAVSSTADFNSWLLALPENGTLEAVTLPLRICDPEKWTLLFKALSAKKSSMKVTISGQCSERYLWEKVCEALMASGAEENIAFDTTLDVTHNKEMLRCRGFSEVYAFPSQDSRDDFCRTFLWLPSLSHITCAHVEIWLPDVDEMTNRTIALYIRTATALRKLHMTVWLRYIFIESTKKCWRLISDSLHQNASIKELRVGVRCMDEQDVGLLVNAVRFSSSIRRIHLTAGKSDVAAAFIKDLRFGLEKNYRLVNITVDGCELRAPKLARDLCVVRSIARRNADLVVSASRFVSGAMEDR
ncbi:hypothetical protein V5799_008436 [Amblyomma americanum]|uniref:Uncharacterized protein n=1 Tax=Amblyomma americanum TaxID=6943 RepID=A0AAQ4E3E0_AMBAM